jgi:hypothetical protein
VPVPHPRGAHTAEEIAAIRAAIAPRVGEAEARG